MSELALKLIEKNKRTKDTFLDLGNCGLFGEIPKEISECIWLEKLNLGTIYYDNTTRQYINSSNKSSPNKFIGHELYFLVSNLTKLSDLYLCSCKIKDFSFLENFLNLNSLDLCNNDINDITFLKKHSKLKTLNLRTNQIYDISPLEKLYNLNTLNLRANQIGNFKFLENLFNLDILDLSSNEIDDISFLQDLTNLSTLNLQSNQIEKAEFIKDLLNLNTLDLRYNKISDISFLKNLTKLNTLYLDTNEIMDISPLSKLTKLNTLDISNNNIKSIVSLSKLFNLDKLTLDDNFVQDISPLTNLIKINKLSAKRNCIEDLRPLSFFIRNDLKIDIFEGKLQNDVEISNNPIITPPPEVIKQGKKAVIRYFEKIENEGFTHIYEAKLTLVGDGGVGKTSLQRRMIDEQAPLPLGEDGTRGINVFDWKFNDKFGNHYIAHIWDFGGQDVYYPVHRFFLTENSVYVLMASTRFPIHNFEYWIPTIYQFGGKSPIILVQNCHGGNRNSWEDVSIFYTIPEYNVCKPFYPINLFSSDNWGLKTLKDFIEQQIISLPHIGKVVPYSWVKVRKLLEKKSEEFDVISYEKFEDLCTNVDEESFQQKETIADLGRFLHDLGIIIWFYKKNELKNLVILKPEWAMKAVYKIIDDPKIQKQNGIILKEDFEQFWNDEKYRIKIHELKLLLQVFKIAFPKKYNKEHYILPLRLSPILEKDKWNDIQPYLCLEYHFEIMPRGIVNQVSADLSSSILSDESVWNNAVVFKNQEGEAQIIEQYHFRKIQIKSRGIDARGIMLLIMDSLKNIINEYEGVEVKIKVPCNCVKCKQTERSTIFEYTDLIDIRNEKRTTITCNKSDTKLNIDDLLYSVGLEFKKNKDLYENRFLNVMDKNKEIPEIFFSYAWDKAGDVESREKIVKDLYESLASDGMNVILDKENLDYKGSISEFMNQIGAGDFIVVAISDAYLKSINCMYEFYEIYKNSKLNKELMRQRIFPIRVESINLNKPSVLETYFDYWEELEREWAELIVKKATRIGAAQQTKYKKIQAIASELGDFLDFLSDINSKSKEELSKDNFKEIKEAIKKRMKD